MTSLTRSWFGSRAPIDSVGAVSAQAAERVIDLKGEKLALGEVHLDITEHFYIIRNGSLSDGDILVGPRVDGRRVTFQNVSLSNVKIRCADELDAELAFVGCGEVRNCAIQADQVTFRECRVLEDLQLDSRTLSLDGCWSLQAGNRTVVPVAGLVTSGTDAANPRTRLRNLEFKGAGGRLVLNRVSLRECAICGNFESVAIRHADLEDCRITAIAAGWEEASVTHRAADRRAGIWAAEVQGELKLKDVSLEGLTVDSEVIANQCEDRSSVDLQNAFVDNEWEVLRDNYSGTLLAFHLMFLFAFVAPLLTKMAMAAGAAGISGLALNIPFLKEQKYEMIPVWEVLLFGFYGMKSLLGWTHAVLTVALLLYNVARVYLTVGIVKLRSREEHLAMQRFRRARPAAWKYRTKILVHRFIMQPLFLLAIASALWKIWDAIKMQIPIPAAG
ncbi:MAG: hypothetical protein H6840_11150 [Planctomycetes bacterium]|nr:hypothetical protein [Planctomycetota bacterium]